MRAALLWLVACSGSSGDEAGPVDPANPAVPGGPDEAALLKAGPPKAGPTSRATTELATALGLATARCPVDGMGRVTQVFGTPRDGLRPVGPTWMLELRPEDIKPWNPTYDIVAVEDRWVTVLAEPGSTGSFLRVADRTLKLEWPAAEKGKQAVCTRVSEVATRTVAGRVQPREARMWAAGCSKYPEPLADDGSFVMDVAAPCTMWLEAFDAHRTQKVLVEPGSDKLQLEDLVWEADDIQMPDKSWTDKGKAKLKELANSMADDVTYQVEVLDRVHGALDGDEPAQDLVERWKKEMVVWSNMINRIHAGVEGKVPL